MSIRILQRSHNNPKNVLKIPRPNSNSGTHRNEDTGRYKSGDSVFPVRAIEKRALWLLRRHADFRMARGERERWSSFGPCATAALYIYDIARWKRSDDVIRRWENGAGSAERRSVCSGVAARWPWNALTFTRELRARSLALFFCNPACAQPHACEIRGLSARESSLFPPFSETSEDRARFLHRGRARARDNFLPLVS